VGATEPGSWGNVGIRTSGGGFSLGKHLAQDSPATTGSANQVVAVVDDDGSARTALARLMKSNGIETAAFASARDFLQAANPENLGCAVIDLWMPDINGLALQQELERRFPCLSVIFVSGNGNVKTSVSAMKAGAVDFLEKPVRKEALLKAVRAALERTHSTIAADRERKLLQQRYDILTPRERQVFGLITAGLLNKQAGAELGAAEKTIKVHRARVMGKMEAQSMADLVRMADRLRIGRDSQSQG
jgi:FixJ family two-component response regulator